MMTPSIQSVMRIRYGVMVGVRLTVLLLFAVAAAWAWRPIAAVATMWFFEGFPGTADLLSIFLQLAMGPISLVLVGAALLKFGPRLSKWIAPRPRPGCPECGYLIEHARGGRCPECGARLEELR